MCEKLHSSFVVVIVVIVKIISSEPLIVPPVLDACTLVAVSREAVQFGRRVKFSQIPSRGSSSRPFARVTDFAQGDTLI